MASLAWGWRPGRNGLFAWAACMACLAASGWTPPLGYVAGVGAALLCLATWLDSRRIVHKAHLGCQRVLPAIVPRGAPFDVTVQVRNSSALTWAAMLRDVLPDAAQPRLALTSCQLGAQADVIWRYSMTLPQRGRYQVGPAVAFVASSWRLIERRVVLAPAVTVKVYPESVARPEGFKEQLAAASRMDRRARTRQRGDGLDFETFSPYQPGDDPRHVDWRASVRAQELLVRRHRLELHRQVMVCIDSGRLMGAEVGCGAKLDRAVDAGLMLCRTALSKGDQCGVAVFDSQVRTYLPPQSGSNAWRNILELTHDAATRLQESDFECMFQALQQRQQKRALVIVLSDIAGEAASARLSLGLQALARRHVLVFAALRSPQVAAYLDLPPRTPEEAARQAVALTLMRDREKALHVLSRAGVHVLDLEPRDVTIPLLNQYLRLRESGRM